MSKLGKRKGCLAPEMVDPKTKKVIRDKCCIGHDPKTKEYFACYACFNCRNNLLKENVPPQIPTLPSLTADYVKSCQVAEKWEDDEDRVIKRMRPSINLPPSLLIEQTQRLLRGQSDMEEGDFLGECIPILLSSKHFASFEFNVWLWQNDFNQQRFKEFIHWLTPNHTTMIEKQRIKTSGYLETFTNTNLWSYRFHQWTKYHEKREMADFIDDCEKNNKNSNILRIVATSENRYHLLICPDPSLTDLFC